MMKDFWLFIVAAIAGVLLACAGLVPAANAQGNTAPDAADDLYFASYSTPPTEANDPIVVNSTIVGDQMVPQIVQISNGNYVVAWIGFDNGQTGYEYGGAGRFRIFSSVGQPLSNETLFDPLLTAIGFPALAPTDDGGFIVCWQRADEVNAGMSFDPFTVPEYGNRGYDIFCRAFNSSGVANTGIFRANETTSRDQLEPSVARLSNGDFVVVWTDHSTASSESDDTTIRGRLFEPNGTAASGEFTVNSTLAGIQFSPAVAASDDARFQVVWTDGSQVGPDVDSLSVRSRTFSNSLVPDANDFQVNTTTRSAQRSADIAFSGTSFLSAWESNSGLYQVAGFSDYYWEILSSLDNGLSVGAENRVSDSPNIWLGGLNEAGRPTDQIGVDIGARADNHFIVAWRDQTISNIGVSLRVIGPNGLAASAEHSLVAPPSGTDFLWPSVSGGSGRSAAIVYVKSVNSGPSENRRDDVIFQLLEFAPLDPADVLPVLANDTDADGDSLTITAINGEAVAAAAAEGNASITSNAVMLASGAGVALADGGVLYDPTTAPFSLALPEGATADDNFTYTISDGALTDTASVTVTVTGVNDVPTADDDELNVLEDDGAADMTALLLTGDVDPDTGEKAQLTISAIDTTGTVGATVLNAGAVTYGPNGLFASLAAGQTASDSFTYTITDPHGATDTAAVSVTITGTNDAPVARDDALATTNTVSLDGNLFADNGSGADSDVDTGDSFTVSAVNGVPGNVDTQITLASGASLTVNSDGAVIYDPNGAFTLAPGATTQDSFAYTITDGSSATNSATVTVTLTGNTPPDAVDDTFTESTTNLEVQGPERIANETASGQRLAPDIARLANGNSVVVWSDGFDYDGLPTTRGVRGRFIDQHGLFSGASYSIAAPSDRDVRDSRIAAASDWFVVLWVAEDPISDAHQIWLEQFGEDGTTLVSARVVGQATNVYQPSLAISDDEQIFVTWRAAGASDSGDIKGIILNSSLDVVTSEFAVAQQREGMQAYPEVISRSSGGFIVVWADVGLNISTRELRYRTFSANGEALSDDFLVAAFSGGNPDHDAIGLAANRFALSWIEDGQVYLSLFDETQTVTTDRLAISNSYGHYSSLTATNSGNIIIVWTSDSGSDLNIAGKIFNPTDQSLGNEFQLNSQDEHRQNSVRLPVEIGDSAIAVWLNEGEQYVSDESIRIRRLAGGPVNASEINFLSILQNDTDLDNDALTITQINNESISATATRYETQFASAVSGPVTLVSGAIVSLFDDGVTYDPTAATFAVALPEEVTTDDTFTYTISDGALTDTANVTVTLTGVNDAPTADADTLSVNEDALAADLTATLLDGDTDPDTGETGQLAITAIDATGLSGSASLASGLVTYGPNAAFEGLAVGQSASDTFSYTIADPGGLTSTATVTVTVNGANDAPTADADALTFAEEEGARDVTSTLLDGDADPDTGETALLTVTAVDTTLTLGQVTLVGGAVSYNPNGVFNALAQGQSANDRFDYTISDPHGGTASATATVTVNGFAGYELTVERNGLGAGTVTSSPPSINCGGGGACQAYFTQGGEVTLSRLVAPESRFVGWGDDCQSAGVGACSVTMSQDRQVSARFELENPPAGRIVAATLPGARSGFVGGGDITVFMTVLSRATSPAQSCRITAPNDPPFTLTYRQINAQNEVIGDTNPLFDLNNGGGINFVIGLTPTRTTDASGYVFLPQIVCENADLAPIEGVNSVLVSIGAAPVPDILSIGATPSADGVVRIPETGNRINFLSAAAVNIGAGDGSAGAGQATVTASVDTGAASLPLTLEVCETASTGGCITPRGVTEVTTVFDPNVAKFFAVFVRANEGANIPFSPANSRVFLRFADAGGVMRSATSAAVSAPAAASDQAEIANLTGRWSVLVRQPSGDWPSLRRASLYVLEDGTAILDDGVTVSTLAFERFAEESEFTRFELGGREGLSGDSRIRSGDALSDQPGALWGVRDARSDTMASWSSVARDYDSLRISDDGTISGTLAGCIVHGASQTTTGETNLLMANVTLTSCNASGRYTAVIDLPANDNETPALLIGGAGSGWRVNAGR